MECRIHCTEAQRFSVCLVGFAHLDKKVHRLSPLQPELFDEVLHVLRIWRHACPIHDPLRCAVQVDDLVRVGRSHLHHHLSKQSPRRILHHTDQLSLDPSNKMSSLCSVTATFLQLDLQMQRTSILSPFPSTIIPSPPPVATIWPPASCHTSTEQACQRIFSESPRRGWLAGSACRYARWTSTTAEMLSLSFLAVATGRMAIQCLSHPCTSSVGPSTSLQNSGSQRVPWW